MNVRIFTECGKGVGYGHLVRCIALYQAFRHYGILPKMVVYGTGDEEDLLKGIKFTSINWINNLKGVDRLAENADVVVIDSYRTPEASYQHISNNIKIPVYFDDFQRLNYPRGVVVNCSICASKIDYPENTKTRFLLGAKYIPLRREFWDQREKIINKTLNKIFISLGGSDVKELTYKLMESLNYYYPKIMKVVIIGKGFKNIDKIMKMKNGFNKLIFSPRVMQIISEMLSSDIAITSNGQTLYELAYIGVPSIVIGLNKNQQKSIDNWNKIGFSLYGGYYSDKNLFSNVVTNIDMLRGQAIRQKKSKIAKEVVDGKGALRIVKKLIDF